MFVCLIILIKSCMMIFFKGFVLKTETNSFVTLIYFLLKKKMKFATNFSASLMNTIVRPNIKYSNLYVSTVEKLYNISEYIGHRRNDSFETFHKPAQKLVQKTNRLIDKYPPFGIRPRIPVELFLPQHFFTI